MKKTSVILRYRYLLLYWCRITGNASFSLCATNESGTYDTLHACRRFLDFRATPITDSVHVITPHPFQLKEEGTDIVMFFFRKTAGVSGPVEGPDQGPAKSLQVER